MFKYWSKIRVTSWFYEGIHYIHWVYVDEYNIPNVSLMNKHWKLITVYDYYRSKEKLVSIPESSLELIK